ncbi:MAG: hypothetical protein ABRQ38_04290, partial [Candidatus Eremiobacterota bacterium]
SEWEKALELEPDHYRSVHGNMGIIYEELKEDDKAWREYELAIKYNPSDANSLFRLGVLMIRENLYEDALALLNEAINLEKHGDLADKASEYIETINKILEEEEEEERNEEVSSES